MGAFTSVTLLNGPDYGTGSKTATFTAVAPASYDAGGSVIDLSSHFTLVHGVEVIGQPTHGNDKYYATFIPAAAYAPSTGKLKIRDLTAASDAEASGDLSAVSFVVRVTGR